MARRKAVQGEAVCPGWKKRFDWHRLPPLVRVAWMDACAKHGPLWVDGSWEGKYTNGNIQYSVGFLMKRDERFVTLAQDFGEGGVARDLMDIPTAIVLEMKVVK